MTRLVRLVCLLALFAGLPSVASAQLGAYKTRQPAIGESYALELSGGLWDPSPGIKIASSALSIIGTEIDAVADLGIQKSKFPDFHIVLRPARKHKLRFEYMPISYDAQATLTRTIVFRGVSYTLGVPVSSSIDWKAYRFGYEYDFLYRDNGFLGVFVDVKYNKLRASITSGDLTAAGETSAAVPTIGAVARAYAGRSTSVTGEITAIKLPFGSSDYGHYVDWDVYLTFNASNNFGFQGGYRSLDVVYNKNDDSANLTLKGPYVRVVLRF